MSRVAVFLHSNATGHQDLLPSDVEWIDVDVSAVVHDVIDRPISLALLARAGARLAHGAGADIRRRLDEFCARNGRVVICADDGALALATAYRYIWQGPIVAIRLVTRDLPPQFGRLGLWFRNRASLVNLAVTSQLKRMLEQVRVGRHVLLGVAGPASDDPESVRRLLSQAVELVGADPGGDEALSMAYVTHVYFNQENSKSLSDLLQHYACYTPALLDRVHFVIVDDGSPIDYELPDCDLNLTWLKIDQDIRWNQTGARNLGMTYARSDNVLVSDSDILVPEHTMAYLAAHSPCGRWIYRPTFLDSASGTVRGPLANIYFLSRARFMRYFGYDEELAGGYGFDDIRFPRFQKAYGTFMARLPRKYYICDRKVDRSASYHSLMRDHTRNAMINARKHFELDWYGRNAGHSRRNLNFTWKVMLDRRRARPAPGRDRLFKPSWYLRQLWPPN